MKGDEKLWQILNDKLEMLRASDRMPEALRVAETALELAQRAFPADSQQLAISFERLGQLRDQRGDRAGAKEALQHAHRLFEKVQPADMRTLYRSSRRLAYLCDNLGQDEEAIRYYEKAIQAGIEMKDLPHSDLGTLLNNVALIYRKIRAAKGGGALLHSRSRDLRKATGTGSSGCRFGFEQSGCVLHERAALCRSGKTHLRALAIREKAHPPTHPDIAQSKCNLAVVYHSNGDYARASELYRASIKAWEEADGKATEGLRDRRLELRRSLAFVRQSAARPVALEDARAKRRRG